MGTGPFVLPSFEKIVASCDHTVCGVITRPEVARRRGKKRPPQPMRLAAERHNLLVESPASINSPEAHAIINNLSPDLFFVCDYGQILSSATLALAPLGGINLHGSLLPKYRGAAPVNWAIYNNDPTTGVTVIHMTPKLDGGPCLEKVETPIAPDETAPDLEDRLSNLGVEAVLRSLNLLDQWDRTSPIGEIQDSHQATDAPRLTKEMGKVDWTNSATRLYHQYRAFQPWPGMFTHWLRRDGQPLRLNLIEVAISPLPEETTADINTRNLEGGRGIVVGKRLFISTGDSKEDQNCLEIKMVQPIGKKPIPIGPFLNGYRIKSGDKFGESSPKKP